MGETPDNIRQLVEQARTRLGQDLNQLEFQVRREINWRVQFNRHPWLFLGVAFGAAFLAGLAIFPRARDNGSTRLRRR